MRHVSRFVPASVTCPAPTPPLLRGSAFPDPACAQEGGKGCRWAGIGGLLALLLLASCRPTGSGDGFPVVFASEVVPLEFSGEGAAYVPVLDGPLRPLSATPNGPMLGLASDQALAVTFSQPMVPLGDTTPVPENALTVSPRVEGTLRWEGTQTLVFAPAAPLPMGTAFTVTVAAGLKAVGGDALEEAFTWTFETPRPLLVASEPMEGECYADPRQALRLVLNQPVDPGAAARFIELRPVDPAGAPVRFTATAAGDTLVLRPAQPLPAGRAFELTLEAGLPGLGGPLGLREATTVHFRTFGPLQLASVTQPRNWWEEQKTGDFDPERGITLTFTTPVRFGDLRRALTFSPAVAWPPGIEAQDDQVGETQVLPLGFPPETRYTVTVRALRDVFGQTLAEGTQTFTTRAYTPSVRMPEGLLVVEASQQQALPVRAVNIDAVPLGVQPLRADQVVPLLRAYDLNHYYGPLEEGAVEPTPLAPNRTFRPGLQRNTPGVAPLRLDSVLTGGTGLVAVRMQTPRAPDDYGDADFRALAVVTHLGVTAKFSPHQNLIFVTELTTAKPVARADVVLRDADNRVRWRGKTDAQGRATSPGWAALGLEPPSPWEAPVQYVFVQRGRDVAFTASIYNDGLEPYRFDLDYAWVPEARTTAGSVFSDRGLYRVGETAHLKGILRQRTDGDWQAITDSVRVLIDSPREQRVFDQMFRPSDLGTFDLSWAVPPSADQGVYTVRVAFAADTAAARRASWEARDLAQGTFRVEAFRTATFAVEARTAAPAYVAGDFFEGTVDGRYLFGAAMGGQPVRYSLDRQAADFAPDGFDGWRFSPFAFYADDAGGDLSLALAQADTVLDADGRLAVRTQLPGNPQGAPTELTWQGVVTDPARQELGHRRRVMLHPGLFYIGLKPRTSFLDLSERQVLEVDVTTVDPNGQPVGGAVVEVTVVREQWNSVREVGVDGRLTWRSERTEEVLGTQQLRAERGRAHRLKVPVREGGSYLVRATGRDVRGNTIRSEAYFYATGSGYVAWERTDDDHLDLVADRTHYRPGETARILVPSPFEQATALITVEREGIVSSRVETLRGSAPQIEIPLTDVHLPNAFVSVVLLNGRAAPPTATQDPGAPGFKVGYVNLRVDPAQRHLRVNISPNQAQYRPGEVVTVDLQLVDQRGNGVAGEIAFSAADAGVLNLLGYALPDPFDTFYGPRPLHVLTSETRAHLVRQRSYGQKEEDRGGGGGTADDLLRDDFRPSAHWVPDLRTDGRGRARLTFRLPESLTTFRLMATGLSRDHRFGAGQTDIVVTQPLVLQAALPRFARVGDTFEAGVLVSNQTGQDGTVAIRGSGNGIENTGEVNQSVPVAHGQTTEVRFRWRAVNAGMAKVTFEATLGEDRDGLTVTLPVLPPSIKTVVATLGSTNDAAREALAVPANLLATAGRFEARFASTALVGLDGAARYLFDYPYGCLEQRTSRIRPLLVATPLLEAFDLVPLGGSREQVVNAWLTGLKEYWTGTGFSLWPGTRWTSPYVGAYVLLALAEAQQAGFTLPADLTAQAVTALETDVRNAARKPDYYSAAVWNDTRALMLFALARHGRLLEGEVAALGDRMLQDPAASTEGLAFVLRTVVAANRPALDRLHAPLLERLRNQVRTEATTAYFTAPASDDYRWIFASDTRATAFGLTALVEADPSAATRPAAERMVRYLLNAQRDDRWGSTQDNIAVVEAFATFFQAYEAAAPRFTAQLKLGAQEIVNHAFQGRSFDVAQANLPMQRLRLGQTLPLEISKTGTGTLYYALLLETYSARPQPSLSQGLVLSRTVQRLDRSGRPAGTPTSGSLALTAGDLVRVTLRVQTPADRHYVVIDDALPGGLEALNAAFETTDARLVQDAGQDRWWGSFNHVELRDDRVLLFADYLERGEHTYTYIARATTPGTFAHPPAYGEQMYLPEVNGRTATGTLTVTLPTTTARR